MKKRSARSSVVCTYGSTDYAPRTRSFVSGVLLLCLLVFVASCTTTEIQYVDRVTYIRPSEVLTTATPEPIPPLEQVENNGALLGYCLASQAALRMCNADKARIRETPLPIPPAPPERSWFDRMFGLGRDVPQAGE